MIEEQEIVKDPFELSDVDEETELRALTRALQLAEGFTLIFAPCNQAPHRRELMASVRSSLHDFNIQEIHLTESISHLLNLLRQEIQTPAPDAIFVSGIEYSLPVAAEAHNTPFVANLNASRNSFRQAVPCPLVLWLPEYALTAIMRGAPDFFSVRSGIYYFSSSFDDTFPIANSIISDNEFAQASLTIEEKEERIHIVEDMLFDYQTLPYITRNYKTEAELYRRLGGLYFSLDRFSIAYQNYEKAAEIAQKFDFSDVLSRVEINIGTIHLINGERLAAETHFQKALEVASSNNAISVKLAALGNLATVKRMQSKFLEAEQLFKQCISLAQENKAISIEGSILSSLGSLYADMRRLEEAIQAYNESLGIFREIGDKLNEAITLNHLGIIYDQMSLWQEANKSYLISLDISRQIGNKRNEEKVLNNLGYSYFIRGEFAHAEKAYKESLAISQEIEAVTDEGFTLINLSVLRKEEGKLNEALEFSQKAIAVLQNTELIGLLKEAENLTTEIKTKMNTKHNLDL